jgi:hypothetical protein
MVLIFISVSLTMYSYILYLSCNALIDRACVVLQALAIIIKRGVIFQSLPLISSNTMSCRESLS